MFYTVNMARRPEMLLVIAFCLTLSACVRVLMLGHANYWLDEMVSLHFAKHENWRSIFWDNHPPLYHILLKGWVALLGDSEVTTRTLSVAFSVAATGVMMRIGLELRGFFGALFFGVFHALSMLSILMARETRMYSMFEFAAALNFLYFLRLLKDRPAVRGFAASSALMAFTHYLAIVPLGIQAAVIAIKKRAVRTYVLAALGIGSVILAGSYLNFFKWESLSWQQFKYDIEPESRWPIGVLTALFNESWLFGLSALAALGTAFLAHHRSADREKRGELLLCLGLVAAPIVILFAFGALASRSVALPRYWVFVIPPLTAAIAAALMDLLPKKALVAGLFGGALLGMVLNAPAVYKNKKEPWKSVAEMISYYPNSLVLTSRTAAIQTPYFEKTNTLVRHWNPRAADGMEMLKKEIRERGRVWIVENYYGGYYLPMLTKELRATYKLTDVSVAVDQSAPIQVVLVEEPRK